MDLDEAKIMISKHISENLRDKVSTSSNDSKQGKTTIKFSNEILWNDILEFERTLNNNGFECVASQEFSTLAYIKIDLMKLCDWLHQKCFTSQKENKWWGLFSRFVPDFSSQANATNDSDDIYKAYSINRIIR